MIIHKTKDLIIIPRLLSLVLLTLLYNSHYLFSQNYKFKHLDTGDGLCHNFIYTIDQDKNGFIWLGTGEGLCKYNGFSFTTEESVDTLIKDVVSASYTDKLANLWFGFNDGTVVKYDGKIFSFYQLGEQVTSAVMGIAQASTAGMIIATQNDGLFLIKGDGSVNAVKGFEGQFITAIHANENYLLLGTQDGLMVYQTSSDENFEKINEIEELVYLTIQEIYELADNNLLIGTEDAGMYYIQNYTKKNYNIQTVGEGTALDGKKIQHIFLDSKNDLWVSTHYGGIIRFQEFKNGKYSKLDAIDEKNGLTSNYIEQVYEDREGNLWIATYGKGLSILVNSSFTFYSFEGTAFGNNILSVVVDDSVTWLGGESFLMYFVDGKSNEPVIINEKQGLPGVAITSLMDDSDKIWIGTASEGIYYYDKNTRRVNSFFESGNSLGNSINNLAKDKNFIYAATKDGIYSLDKTTREQFHYNTMIGLPHNDIEYVYLDNDNRLLFATRSDGIYEINEVGEVVEYFSVGDYELEFNSIAQDHKGRFWVSTFGQGVFHVTEDTIINFTEREGLKSNYCYAVVSSDNQYLWVGHSQGLTRINTDNYTFKIYDADQGFTGGCNLNAFYKSDDRYIHFGTEEGLIRYNIKADVKRKVAPLTNITAVLISDTPYDFSQSIVLPYKSYKLRVEFIGLNFSDPKSVKYQYMLEGYDLEWSDLTGQPYVIYPRLDDGEYIFKVRAYNSDGLVQEVPAEFRFKIKKPFWKTIWFILLSALIIILVVVFIIKFREKKQKQIQDYLEKRLDERTREVVIQKEEIEIKNRDITDSINYAQRIQASILPPVQKLQSNFVGSFVFYQPRDIVSGDFYWFDKLDNNKFIIVCADSTGHGVPGAFMSMIGTTLIKDICMRSDVNSPSQILEKLDEELRGTLNQNIEASSEQSNDGMDIIVAEIDTKSYYLRYASAMRPMIVYRNGEQIYIKGSRSSVGGHYNKDEKEFRDEGIQLGKGDLIYMFSDGYPDQFGGPVGKKFKMVRLKNLLRDIYKKTMEEQYEYVKSTFNLWKEEMDQVDDVLFMGIKL